MTSKPRRYMERRFASLDPDSVEVRESDDHIQFRGHAAVFNQEVDFGFMREVVAPGAFTKTIKDKADVRFLFNHNPDTVMARTTLGTLRLSEDKDGLKVDADLDPEDHDVQRLTPKLRSGNVDQMSFGFSVVRDEMTEDESEDTPLRILREVELFDVSPVTFPAYAGTDGGLRAAIEDVQSRLQVLGLPLAFGPAQARDADALLRELQTIPHEEITPEQIRTTIDALSALLANDDAPLPDGAPGDRSLPPLDHFKRVLDLNRNRIAAA